MKKILLTLCVLLLSFNNSQAQVKFGLKTGLNMSALYGDIDSDNYRTGVYAGGYVRIPLSGRFSVQPEVLFSMQGATTNDWDNYWNHWDWDYYRDRKEEYRMNYINIPIMFQYHIIKGLRAELGPQFSFAVSKEYKSKRRSYYNDTYPLEYKTKKDLKDFDFGLNLGANYELANGINFSLRYSAGFINILESSNNYYDDEIRNQVFSLGLGYSF